jgi:hypothetical protein
MTSVGDGACGWECHCPGTSFSEERGEGLR